MPAPQIQTVPTEYKPWGLTAGAIVGQQQYDTEAANLQALNEARLANVGHERDAMLAQGQMDNPAWLQSKIAGEIGQGQSLAATGEYDKGVLKSKLAEGIAKNVANLSENQVKQQLAEGTKQLNTMKLGLTYLAGPNGQNPAALTGFLQKYGADMGLPPEVHQQLLQAEQQKPGTIKQAISALIPHLQEAISITPQVYAEMAKNKAQIQDTETITKSKDRENLKQIHAADNATRIQVENLGIDAGKYKRGGSGVSITAVFAKMTPQARLGAVQKVLTTGVDPETGEALTEMAKIGYEAMYNQDKRTVDASNAAKGANKVDLNAVGVTATPLPSVGGGSQNNSGQTKSGVKFKVLP